MRLTELIVDSGATLETGHDTDVTMLTADSRAIRPGSLFAALPGHTTDGRQFIDAAVAAGAVALLVPAGTTVPCAGVAVVSSVDPRRALAHMAARFFGAAPTRIVAVTGTNGKSSIVHFCRQLWECLGINGASLGTLGIASADINRPGRLTTPDAVSLHADLAELHAHGVTHLAMETSSQGLDQHRADGVRFSAGAFTNLTRDHLDYHGTMENYLAAKLRLFTELLPPAATAIINRDMPYFDAVRNTARARGHTIIDYGPGAEGLNLLHRRPTAEGQILDLAVFGERRSVELPLIGDFQASNALCALGLIISERPQDKLFVDRAVRALEALTSVRGRLEYVGTLKNGARVYVDYAHSPDGLETMLKAFRPHVTGRLHVIFGCGGDRDRGKRPLMGAIAVANADHVIVTDDNPRSEDAASIRHAILQAARGAEDIPDRRRAISAGIAALQASDALVIAGKGHEQGQIIGDTTLPFDDAAEARQAMKGR